MSLWRRQLNLVTHRMHTLPLLVLMPHSRCNARCLMCDIWKANADKRELSKEQIAAMLEDLEELGVERVVFSGGEALLYPNLWPVAEMIFELGVRMTLLSTGLTLGRYAAEAVRWLDDVVVSLDGSREIHDAIRNVDGAYDRLVESVQAVKREKPSFRITGRCVVQRMNFADLPRTIEAARAAGLDQISFLPVDVSSEAFNRLPIWTEDRVSQTALTLEEVERFAAVVEDVIAEHGTELDGGFIAEGPAKLRRIVQYFRAIHGKCAFPAVACNAPWMSAVVEADGQVRPCFFHRAFGNVHAQPLGEILSSKEAIAFRRELDVASNPTCARCVCTLQVGLRARL